MIDNLELIKPLLEFESDNEFYFLSILQRKKENPQLRHYNRAIRHYYINSFEYLEERYDEIKSLCGFYNARACINLEVKNYREVGMLAIKLAADLAYQEQYGAIKAVYDSACGQAHSRMKRWVLDVDDVRDDVKVNAIQSFIKELQPSGEKVIVKLPSKTGVHLITSPFDPRAFYTQFPDVEIKKKSPTNLFIP